MPDQDEKAELTPEEKLIKIVKRHCPEMMKETLEIVARSQRTVKEEEPEETDKMTQAMNRIADAHQAKFQKEFIPTWACSWANTLIGRGIDPKEVPDIVNVLWMDLKMKEW